jgi:hypothetical protein
LTVVKISPIAAADSEEDSTGCFQKQTFKLLQHLKTQNPKPQIQTPVKLSNEQKAKLFQTEEVSLHNPKLAVHATGTLNGLLFEQISLVIEERSYNFHNSKSFLVLC